MIHYKFPDPVTAWSELIKKFLNQEEELFTDGQGAVITGSVYSYGVGVLIEKAQFDPEFDFGLIMGYTQSKWSSLLNNYLDLDAMDVLKTQIRELEKNKAQNRNYHIGFNFADSHGNGKGCLVSGVFSRMIGIDNPRLTIVMRASDIVTRLPWDLLLAVRLGAYVYGHEDFSIELFLRSAFADDITVMLYNGYEDIEPLIANIENEDRRKKLKKTLKKVKKAAEQGTDPGYQAYTRVYKIFNPEAFNIEPKSLKAKDCIIGDWDGIPMPKGGCPSIITRNAIKKAYLKFTEKYNLDLFGQESSGRKLIKFKENDGSIGDATFDDNEESEDFGGEE